MNTQHWQDRLIALVGFWLLLSALFLVGDMRGAFWETLTIWNFALCGAVAVSLGVLAMTTFQLWQEWLAAVVGVWLIASSWVLDVVDQPIVLWNSILSGSLLVLASALAMSGDEGGRRA